MISFENSIAEGLHFFLPILSLLISLDILKYY